MNGTDSVADDAGEDVSIGPLDRSGVAQAIAWAAREGWNPGVDDLEPFLAADPGGFFGGRVNGALAVTVSAVRYGPEFGFGGFYIAAPAFRGHGIAYRVSRAARAHLADCAVIGLDAVLEQEATYARDGFVTAHATTRFVLDSPTDVTGPAATRITLGDIRGVSTGDLVEFEVSGRMFPARRPRFLAAWVAMPSAVGRVAYDDAGRIRGWGLRRRCVEGHRVGPLFADDAEVADALWRAIVADADGPVFLDVPDPNAEARALVRRFGMTPGFSTRRMYAGGDPDLVLARVFGVTTLELG